MEQKQQILTGIQQAGIGVYDAEEAKHLYKELFGMNVLVFDDCAEASLMTQYTGSEVHQRRAILSLNMAGGGGFEIWQFTSRQPAPAAHRPQPGDLGLFAIKIKTSDVRNAHRFFAGQPNVELSPISTAPDGRPHCWLYDPYGNCFNIVEGDEWFSRKPSVCGGVAGAVIGVSDIERSRDFYQRLLGIDEVVYAVTDSMPDLPPGHQHGRRFKRILLRKKLSPQGAFSRLLGTVQIELVQALDHEPQKIYENRYWGDPGFIHLCFDVLCMDRLKTLAHNAQYQFTVDSAASFSMGSSAGRFCYVEDPDGTLIELVETHKVPILKKFGLYLNLKSRGNGKPLPDWMIGMMAMNRIK